MNQPVLAFLSPTRLRFIQSICAVTAIVLAGLLTGPGQVAQAQQNQTVCTTLAAVAIRPGDPTVAGSSVGPLTSLYTVPYTGTTTTSQCTAAQTGAIWGLAVQRSSPNVFYTSAVMMSGAGFGSGGSGGIYRSEQDKPASAALFVNLDAFGFVTRPANFPATNAARGLSPNPTNNFNGAVAQMFVDSQRTQVGRMSLGDIDVAPTNDALWTVNLFDRSLIRIHIPVSGTNPTASDIVSTPIPAPTSNGDPICVRNEYRPWGLKVLTDTVYVGVVCSDENHVGTEPGENVNPDLRGVVYQYNIAGKTWTLLTITSNNQALPYFQLNGYRWDHDINSNGTRNRQYIMVDIEIDTDGSFIIGLADRWPMVGRLFGDPVQPWSQGDILRLCNAGGSLTLESNGTCPNGGGHGPTTSGANDLVGYYDDLPDDPIFKENHAENQTGGIALLPLPESQLASMAYNTVNPSGAGNRSGFQVFDNKTGEVTRSFELLRAGTEAGYGKAGGLGDIEVLCNFPTADGDTDEPAALHKMFIPFVIQ